MSIHRQESPNSLQYCEIGLPPLLITYSHQADLSVLIQDWGPQVCSVPSTIGACTLKRKRYNVVKSVFDTVKQACSSSDLYTVSV